MNGYKTYFIKTGSLKYFEILYNSYLRSMSAVTSKDVVQFKSQTFIQKKKSDLS